MKIFKKAEKITCIEANITNDDVRKYIGDKVSEILKIYPGYSNHKDNNYVEMYNTLYQVIDTEFVNIKNQMYQDQKDLIQKTIMSEDFIDKIIERINRKQLK
jgi:hypothetical protein